MAFVDEIKLKMKAGKGGDGVVRWLHGKGRPLMGPAGGNGGRGGNVYVRAIRDVHILSKYVHKKEFVAENGGDGAKNSLHGRDGKDIEVELPIGSVITNLNTGDKFSLEHEGEKILVLNSGRGGLGNEHFKSSTNRSPKEFTLGDEGESSEFLIELELFADVGFIGLPNAGKSSLLNSITRAHAKIGAYAFTTLEPNLGEMYGFILADLPGLIEGAAEGKGLGHKFLRHVKRTKMLAHLVALDNEDLKKAYKSVRDEIKKYDPVLFKKREILILTKSDMVSEVELKKKIKIAEKLNDTVFTVSLYDDKSVKDLQDKLVKLLKAEE
ncbi:MAG: GTPase ObgE [Candidatus Paceibacterota bacterium]|jgi:GTP-binding protein